jgi:phospholipid transport system substrate-binding protein
MTLARGLVLAAGLLLLLGAPRAWAGAPTDQLKARIDRAIKVLDDQKDAKVQERRTAVREIANEIFDFAETAKRSLARHWTPRTPAEREEFVRLFADLLERSYISRIELYGGEKIAYVGETIDGDQAAVRTRLVTKQGTEIPVEYRMHLRDGKWLVYDVVIEGVSLIANYRAQFNKIITTASYQELVKRMKTKQEEFLYQDQPPKRT